MEKKITVLNLIDELAQQADLTQTASEEFIRSFFTLIEEGLMNDGIVKIKGWGTFKVSATSDRESVDVNNGERIVIKGYKKVSFVPENSLKDFINRPFSQFETAELDDGYAIDDEIVEDVKNASGEDIYDESSAIEEIASEMNQEQFVVPDNVMSGAAEESAVENDETEIAKELKSVEETASIETESVYTTPVAESVFDASFDVPMISEAGTDESLKVADKTPNDVEAPLAETIEEMPQKAGCEADKDVETQPLRAIEETESKNNNELPLSYKDTSKTGKYHRASWKYWLPILALILVAVCLFIYFFYSTDILRNTPFSWGEKDKLKVESISFNNQEGTDKDETVTPDMYAEAADEKVEDSTSETAKELAEQLPVVTAAPSDNVAPETDTSELAISTQKPAAESTKKDSPEEETNSKTKPSASETVKENAAALPPSEVSASSRVQLSEKDLAKNLKDITMADTTSFTFGGVLATHKLQAGETIIRLSQIYYGDKRLWPYIVKYNNMATPNSVQTGTAIKIPVLKNKKNNE